MSDSLDLLSPVWLHLTQIQPVRAENIYLYDANGKRYIDFTSGIGVTSTGHCHPRVVRAIQEQAKKLLFAQINIVIPPVTLELAETLRKVTPPSLDAFFFSNSGAEAVEASVKLARHATKRQNIIVFHGSFHGRTAQTMAMSTSKYIYRYQYQPLPGGIFVAPYPYSYFYGWDEHTTSEFCLKELDRLLHSQSAPEETAAFIIEAVLGEGGYVPAPIEFLQGLRSLCDEKGILLICDEVQCGLGRTGKMFGFQHAGIEADIIVLAKGLGSGLPISAVAANHALMARWEPGSHGGTYGGGSAVAIAAAKASLEVILEEGLVENAAAMGEVLLNGLRDIQARYPIIGDVRGLGLMVGTEFTSVDGKPDKSAAKKVQNACIQQNLLLLTCGTYENVIRWIPPLVVKRSQIEEALAIFERAVKSVS